MAILALQHLLCHEFMEFLIVGRKPKKKRFADLVLPFI